MNDAQEAINEYPKLNSKFKSLGKILPDYTVKFIQDISDDVLKLIEKDKIEGIILDVDETLRDNMQDLSIDIKEWLKRLSHKFKVVVLSNGNDYKVKEDLDSINIKYISGVSPDSKLVEIVEIKDHPWAVGCQFHPELKSRPNRPHPLFRDLVKKAKEYKGIE